jgi:hypothetical protein
MTSVHPMPSEEKAYGERLNMKRRPADTDGKGRAPMILQTQQSRSRRIRRLERADVTR